MAVTLLLAGCGGSDAAAGSDASTAIPDATAVTDDEADDTATNRFSDDASPTCLIAGQFGCPPLPPCSTSMSGVVYDPAGKNPLYGAVVYIPNETPQPIEAGTNACHTCEASIPGDYVAATITDDTGAFTLEGTPSGAAIPLVVQVGKWRRQVLLPSITRCQNTPLPAELTRLPRNQSEGDMPALAVLTGECDQVACFLDRVGIDASEFTGPGGGGRVHVYRGVGPGPDLLGGGQGPAGDCSGASGPCPLWSTKASLERYDDVFLGCECGENNQTKPDMTPMHDWLGEGGRLFAIHNQETWLKNGPSDFQDVATWSSNDAGAAGPFTVDTTTPLGGAFDKWLSVTAALNTAGTLALNPADVAATVARVNPATTTPWIYGSAAEDDAGADASSDSGFVELLSVTTPVPAEGGSPELCGRAIVTDIHVGANGATSAAGVPASCAGGDMSPAEKALEFMLFDEGACVSTKVLPPPAHDF
jgi:hypothetical protein